MKTTIVIIALISASRLMAGTLTELGSQFATSIVKGDFASIENALWGKTKESKSLLKSIKELNEALNAGEVSITYIDKELIIGDLGVTLIKFQTNSGDLKYAPIICVKDQGQWSIVPYSNENDLRAFATNRTEDEKIHLKLFERWAALTQKQLEKAEQVVAPDS